MVLDLNQADSRNLEVGTQTTDASEIRPRDDTVAETVVSRKWIVLIYVLAIAVRMIVAFAFGNHPPKISDAVDYDGLASRLLETGTYCSDSGTLISLRPPLFPALVAILYKLFGTHNYLAVSLTQTFLSLLTMIATHRIGILLAGQRVGLIAAAIIGFYPSLLAFNCFVLSETLFTLFFTLGVLCSLRFQAAPTLRWAIGLGLCLSFGALTRSILWVCCPILLLYLVAFSQGSIRQRLGCTVLTLFAFLLCLSPWIYRNTELHRTLTIIDVMGGRNVMMGNYEYTPLERSWATVTDVQGEQAWNVILQQAFPAEQARTQGQIDKLAMKYGIRYFFANPTLSAKRCVIRFFNFWQLERTVVAGLKQQTWGSASKMTLLLAALTFLGAYALVLYTSLIGLCMKPVIWQQQCLLLLWIALPCAIHTIAFAHSRYHLPCIPILACYSAIAIRRWNTRNSLLSNPRRAVVMGTVLFLLFAFGWAREIVMVDLKQFLS